MKKRTYTQENIESIMKTMATHFGKDCEITLHDFSKGFEHSIVAIENAHVTNRTIGSSITNAGLETLTGNQEQIGDGIFNYFSTTEDGRIIRSSTAILRDKTNKIIGSLCINQDISQFILAENVIKTLTKSNEMNKEMGEVFVSDVNELLEHYIHDCLEMIGKPPALMTKEDQYRAIEYLENRGVFSITKAGPKVCEAFNITKYLLYRLLDSIRSHKHPQSEEP